MGIILGVSSKSCTNLDISQKMYIEKEIKNNYINSEDCSLSNVGNILANSISKAISTTLQIGGFVVLFSVILSILNRLNLITSLANLLELIYIPKELSCGIISGIIELTNGVSIVSNLQVKNISLNILLCSFLLGFGGFSVLLQVLGITSKVKLSIKKYFYGKFLQGIIAALYTSIFITNFSIFNLDIPNTMQDISMKNYSFCLLCISALFTIPIFFNHKRMLSHNKKFN